MNRLQPYSIHLPRIIQHFKSKLSHCLTTKADCLNAGDKMAGNPQNHVILDLSCIDDKWQMNESQNAS